MKKIALFIGQLFGEYQTGVTKALEIEAKAKGYQLDVFMNFGIYGNNFLYAEGEKSIRFIPRLEDYEGIIMASDTYELPGFDEELCRFIRQQVRKPIISLRKEDADCYSVIIDDKQSMRNVVEHFVDHHGFTRVCFMTGKMQMVDAQRRLEGYREVMAEHNIEVTDHMIFYGNYWRNMGREAVEWFLDQPERPQAIVCSNDYMAISVCDALQERGLKLPDDICVSGFDDTDEGKFYIPSISSMRLPHNMIGKRAIEILDEILHGGFPNKRQMIPVEMRARGTCGCTASMDYHAVQELLSQKVNLEHTLSSLAYMSVSFDNANTIEQLLETANFYCRVLPFQKMYLCLRDEEETAKRGTDIVNPYTERMILRAILGGNEVEIHNEKFDRRELIPEKYRKSGETMYIVTMHDKTDYFGYLAMFVDELMSIDHVFQIWLLSFSDALGKLKMYQESQELTDMRKKFEIDVLTGIGNRRMLDREVRTRHEKLTANAREPFTLFSIDMDDLKMINDTYGHQMGDEALCTLAHILDKECGEAGCAMRIGGDEFQVWLDVYSQEEIDDYINRVRRAIGEVNASKKNVFYLSASIGFAVCRHGIPLMESIKEADDRMYREKRDKKKNRGVR